jgi:hypothetical protein
MTMSDGVSRVMLRAELQAGRGAVEGDVCVAERS